MYLITIRLDGEQMSVERPEDKELLDGLYHELFRKLFAYAKAILHSNDLAEEAVQDTFKIACEKIDKMTGSGNPAGWLVTTLKNVISNMQKSRQSLYYYMSHAVSFDNIPDTGKPDEENVDMLYQGLASEEDFALLKCIVLKKYSYLEAAQQFGISVEACKKRVQRIKKRLRENCEK